jgi:hypothetical protein
MEIEFYEAFIVVQINLCQLITLKYYCFELVALTQIHSQQFPISEVELFLLFGHLLLF